MGKFKDEMPTLWLYVQVFVSKSHLLCLSKHSQLVCFSVGDGLKFCFWEDDPQLQETSKNYNLPVHNDNITLLMHLKLLQRNNTLRFPLQPL